MHKLLYYLLKRQAKLLLFKRVWKVLGSTFCVNMGFSGPSHDPEESNVITILLHCIEEEMHFSVRYGAFQASYQLTILIQPILEISFAFVCPVPVQQA